MEREDFFELYRGDDHGIQIAVEDELGHPVDIRGWSFKATLTLNPYEDTDDAAAVKVDLDNLSGDAAANGVALLLLPHQQTKDLLPTRYYFDIQREAYGAVTTIFFGRVRVKTEATKRMG